MKILFVIPRLTAGGAERVAARLANRFSQDGHSVAIVTLASSVDFYELDRDVARIRLGLMGSSATPVHALLRNLSRVARLHRTIAREHPDAVVSFLNRTNVRTLLAAMRTGAPVIVSEHDYRHSSSIGALWEAGRRLLYPRAFCLVSVSRGIDESFGWMPASRRAVIPNPLDERDAGAARPADRAPERRRRIGALGRLVPVKGFDVLIRAFGRSAASLPDWDLVVMGDGPLRQALEELVSRLGLRSRVSFTGYVRDVTAALATLDMFCMASRSEGLGLSLLEAMSCGLPVVSTDCPTGPREFITHEQNGLLVPVDDEAALAGAMLRVAGDRPLAERLAAAARVTADSYRMERVFPRWRALVKRAAGSMSRPSRRP